jgi:MFS family permease
MSDRVERVRRSPLQPYLEVLRVPGAWQFSAAGFIGRMPWAMFGLGTVLLISGVTGRYGTAGAVSAVGSAGYAFASPLVARLVDRNGQHRVLIPLVSVFATATAALVAVVEAGAPTWTWYVSGTLSGSSIPALGPMIRARWSALLSGTPRLHTAFSYESVADELCFIIGPAAVTLLASVHPASGVGVAAVLCLGGTLWLAAQRRTEPAVAGPEEAAEHGGSLGRGLVVLVPTFVLLGAMFMSIDLSTVAFAQHFGHRSLAGLILATNALGSATGGLWYGSRHWRAPDQHRLLVALCLTAAGVATYWMMPGLAALTVVMYLTGLTIAPTMIAGFGLLENQSSPGRRTEAMTWLASGISVGAGAGGCVVGFVVDGHGARSGYLLAAACGAAACVVCLAGYRRLRVRAPQSHSLTVSAA